MIVLPFMHETNNILYADAFDCMCETVMSKFSFYECLTKMLSLCKSIQQFCSWLPLEVDPFAVNFNEVWRPFAAYERLRQAKSSTGMYENLKR